MKWKNNEKKKYDDNIEEIKCKIICCNEIILYYSFVMADFGTILYDTIHLSMYKDTYEMKIVNQ